MTVYSVAFYILAVVIVAATLLAVTRRNLAHAVVCIVFSFFASALLFYLLGAPLLAALEVIIYAGAIMILFLFIVMMMRLEDIEQPRLTLRGLLPVALVSLIFIALGVMLIATGDAGTRAALAPAVAAPQAFGQFLFQRHWLAIEITSLLLLVALIGALHIGRAGRKEDAARE
jgi:NADH-quinone oxidoreductase subunit J